MKTPAGRLAIGVSIALAVALVIIGVVARGQAPPVPRVQNPPPGRYVIYYHPANFNQALLLDTATGGVWRMQTMYVVAPEKTAPDKTSPQFDSFQRVTVEGLYHSEEEAKAMDRATPKPADEKDTAPVQ